MFDNDFFKNCNLTIYENSLKLRMDYALEHDLLNIQIALMKRRSVYPSHNYHYFHENISYGEVVISYTLIFVNTLKKHNGDQKAERAFTT